VISPAVCATLRGMLPRRLACALHVAFGFAALIGPVPAYAADLAWTAPGDCATRASAQEQIERLVGRSLAEVEHVDFQVEIARSGAREWRVAVRTIARDGGARVRELTGASCAEVADAAAVAIAMAIEASDESDLAQQPPAGDVAADDAPVPPDARARDEAPAQPAPERTSTAASTPASPDALRFALGAGLMLDHGSLPELAPGAELALSLGWRALRLTALGEFFPNQQTRLSSNPDHGGEFRLALGGLLACGERGFGALAAFGCGGFELGRLSAKGIGVHNPRFGDSGWQALRAELGGRYEFVAGLGVLLRAGIALPLERRAFVLDATQTVHRPSSAALRALIGLELGL
jgi:hypothetical protein